jgi:tRNA(fMet)-specific endonuclease VapC
LVKILDTDTCVEMLRGNRQVIDRRDAIPDTVATTWITAAELAYGAAKSRQPEHNQNLVIVFLNSLPVLDINLLAADRFGATKARLERGGQSITDADLLIASICMARGASLVTGNRRHYERIPGLLLEDWIRP